MALPLFDVPKYKLELPSSGKTVEYRPFLVKEQKVLLMAAGAGVDEQSEAVLNVIDACTFGKVDVKKLANFDAEYIFLQIRARSVGENVDLIVTCGGCQATQNDVLDLTNVQVLKDPEHKNIIDVNESLTIEMGYPSLNTMETYNNLNVEETIALIANNIRGIYQGDEKYDAADYSMGELIAFVENLSPAGLEKLEHFFATMPKLQHRMSWKCQACEQENTITMSGLKSFFV